MHKGCQFGFFARSIEARVDRVGQLLTLTSANGDEPGRRVKKRERAGLYPRRQKKTLSIEGSGSAPMSSARLRSFTARENADIARMLQLPMIASAALISRCGDSNSSFYRARMQAIQ